MRTNTKRFLAGLLSLLMVVAMLPSLAWAEETTNGVTLPDSSGTSVTFEVANDAQLADVVDILCNTGNANYNTYKGKTVTVQLGAGTFTGTYNIKQFPIWNYNGGSPDNPSAIGTHADGNKTSNIYRNESNFETTAIEFKGAANNTTIFKGVFKVFGSGNCNDGADNGRKTEGVQHTYFTGINFAHETLGETMPIQMYAQAAFVKIDKCRFEKINRVKIGNSGTSGGYGVYVTIANSEFIDCSTAVDGYAKKPTLLDNLTVTNCNALLNIQNGENGFGDITVSNCNITGLVNYVIRTNGGTKADIINSKIHFANADIDSSHKKTLMVAERGKNDVITFKNCELDEKIFFAFKDDYSSGTGVVTVDKDCNGFTSWDKVAYENAVTDENAKKNKVVIEVPVAKIGSKTYATLQAAFDEAKSGDTIELLSDVALSSPAQLNKEGTFTLDGAGYKIKPATGANFGADGCLCFGDTGTNYNKNKVYVVKNTTFTGFKDISNEPVRAEGCNITLDGCKFTDNKIVSGAGRSQAVVIFSGTTGTVKNSEFSTNTAGLCIDFNTQAGDPNANTGTSLLVDNCLFKENSLAGNGVVYAYGPAGDIKNSTFENNTINNGSAAVVYMSGTCNVTANAFKGNKTTTGGTKEAVVIVGSSATNSKVQKNAFISHTFEGSGAHALVNVGATGCNLFGNYWQDGKAPETGDNKDIIEKQSAVISNHADSYEKNTDNYGVTVHIAPVTLTFDSNGGSAVKAQKVEYGEAAEKPENPTRADYVFAGWNYKNGEKAGTQFLFDSKLTQDVEIIANWLAKTDEGKITVKDTDEGIKAETDVKKADIPMTTNEVQKVEEGGKLDVTLTVKAIETKNTPKTDKELVEEEMTEDQKLGTYLDLSMVKVLYDKDNKRVSEESVRETLNVITVTVTVPEALREEGRKYSIIRVHNGVAETLLENGEADKNWQISFETDKFSTYALVYEDGTFYNVTFDANGGTGTMDKMSVKEGSTVKLPESTFKAPEGKKFKCWSIDGQTYNAGSEFKVTKDITVKAEWTASVVTADFASFWMYLLIAGFALACIGYGIIRLGKRNER